MTSKNNDIPYLTFNDVLLKCGIENLDRVLLIRHTIPKEFYKDPKNLEENLKIFTMCQSIQFKGKYDYWAVFIGVKGTSARFFKIYKVGENCIKATPDKTPKDYPRDFDFRDDRTYLYDLEEFDCIPEYNNRLVIEWGKGAINWGQIAGKNPKPIVALMDAEKKDFPGYENIILKYDELRDMVYDPVRYEAWHSALSAVYGVYIILDTKTGNQYIGSATGKDGLLGRWSDYAYTGHGNDKLLIDLLKKEPEAYENFQFSILRILPNTTLHNQVVTIESQYKEKLGSRSFGLNAN